MKAFRPLAWALALLLTAGAARAWSPPANPDPDVIVNEALADAAHGRFAEAAQKHVWYHDNAVRLKPSHAQIRLTFVLEEWIALARRYPPAMQDILHARSRAIERVQAAGADLNEAFTEVVRINEMLGDAESTRAVYADLGKHDETLAARFWLHALPALAKLQDHALAFRYLQVDMVLETIESQVKAMNSQPGVSADDRAMLVKQMGGYLDLTLARVIWVLKASDRPQVADDVAKRGRALLGPAVPTPMIDTAVRGDALPASAG